MQNFSFYIQVYQLHTHIWVFLNKWHVKTICRGCWCPGAAGKRGIRNDFLGDPFLTGIFSVILSGQGCRRCLGCEHSFLALSVQCDSWLWKAPKGFTNTPYLPACVHTRMRTHTHNLYTFISVCCAPLQWFMCCLSSVVLGEHKRRKSNKQIIISRDNTEMSPQMLPPSRQQY